MLRRRSLAPVSSASFAAGRRPRPHRSLRLRRRPASSPATNLTRRSGHGAPAAEHYSLRRVVAGGIRRTTRGCARRCGRRGRRPRRGAAALGRAVHLQPRGPHRRRRAGDPRPAGRRHRVARRRRRFDRRHPGRAGRHRRPPAEGRAPTQRRAVVRPQLGARRRHRPLGRVHRRRRHGAARLGGGVRRPRRRPDGRHRLRRRPVRQGRRHPALRQAAGSHGAAVRRARGVDRRWHVRGPHRPRPPGRRLPRRPGQRGTRPSCSSACWPWPGPRACGWRAFPTC